jgi:branched-chain amino acid transport system substrate-binding protein
MMGLSATRKRLKAYGVDSISELVLPSGAVDASSQVLNFRENKVDYVIICDSFPPVITLLKTAQQFNYQPKNFFSYVYSSDDMIVKACGDDAKNYIAVTYMGAWNDNSRGIKLVRQIAEKYNRTEIGLRSQYIHGVGTSMLFGEAMKRAGKDLTPDTLKAAFETFREYDTGGIFPPITYTSKSHAPDEMVRFIKADVPNKCFVSFTDWRRPREMK